MGTSDDEHGRVSWTTPGDVERLIDTERELLQDIKRTVYDAKVREMQAAEDARQES